MVKKGDKAPDFRLKGNDGRIHSLADFKGKYLVLYFYPRDMTPGCTIEANNFNKRLGELKRLKAEVVGVSNDSIEKHGKFATKCDLKFLLLSDESNKTMKAYGAYGSRGVFGIGTLRNTYVIKDAKVLQAFEKVNAMRHVDEVVEFLSHASGK